MLPCCSTRLPTGGNTPTTVPQNATQLNCAFNNGSGTWDNNNGQNWNFNVTANTNPQPPLQPQNLVLAPAETNQINLTWAAASGASGYIVNRAGLPVAMTSGTTFADSGLTANTYYCYSIVASNSIGFSTPSSTVCTNTLASVPTNFPPFVIDGAFDFPGYQIASNGLALYAALRGNILYVATGSPGTSGPNDYFIFVSDQLLSSASNAAPWAKSGHIAVASTKPYLATESQNSYLAWYNAPTNARCAKSSSTSGALEGTIDLVAAFGSMPTNIYLCAAAYATADAGALTAACPAGSGPDIGTNGFLVIPTIALRDNNADGKFDRLDPSLDFTLQNLRRAGSGYGITWAAMPGHSYQIFSASALGAPWINLPGTLSTAGPVQIFLTFTDTHFGDRYAKILQNQTPTLENENPLLWFPGLPGPGRDPGRRPIHQLLGPNQRARAFFTHVVARRRHLRSLSAKLFRRRQF